LDDLDTAAEMGRRGFDRICQWGLPEDICGLRQALAAVTGKLSAPSRNHLISGCSATRER
jgi:hypothetical protein